MVPTPTLIIVSINGSRPYSRFEYGIKSEETKRKYASRLGKFFDFYKIEGRNNRRKANEDHKNIVVKLTSNKTKVIKIKFIKEEQEEIDLINKGETETVPTVRIVINKKTGVKQDIIYHKKLS